MRKLALLALLAMATCFALTGCIQANSDVTINKDGSGSAKLIYSLSPSIAEAMAEMKELGMDNDEDMSIPTLDELDKKELEKNAKKHGVKLKKYEIKEIKGRETLTMSFEFEDLKGLSFVMGSAMGASNSDGMGIFDAGDGNYVLRSTIYDFGEEIEEEVVDTEDDTDMSEMNPEQMQAQMAIMGKMMGAMAELEVRMAITVPGKIISSNAPKTEGKTSIWEINSSNMMTAGADMEPKITFAGKGLKIKALQ